MGERSKANYIIAPVAGTAWWMGKKAISLAVDHLPLLGNDTEETRELPPALPTYAERTLSIGALASRRFPNKAARDEAKSIRNDSLAELGISPTKFDRFERNQQIHHDLGKAHD
jgi:hypothetical protein